MGPARLRQRPWQNRRVPSRPSAIAPVLALVGAVMSLAGCATTRPYVPDLAKVTPASGFRTISYPGAGVALEAPRDWTVSAQRSPLVMVATSGPATVALWRYRTSLPLPVGPAALGQEERALVAAARARQPALRVVRSAVVQVEGRGAVELDTLQTLDGQPRRLRSMHIYLPGAELVLEEYAPPSLFHSVDHAVFSPVKRSLRLLTAHAA